MKLEAKIHHLVLDAIRREITHIEAKDAILTLFQVPPMEWGEDDEVAGVFHCDFGTFRYIIFSMASGKFSAEVNGYAIDLPYKTLPLAQEACRLHAQNIAWTLLGVDDES